MTMAKTLLSYLHFAKAMRKNVSTSFSKQFRILLFSFDNSIIYLASLLMIWNGSKITVTKFIADTKSQLLELPKKNKYIK